jgi:hypothetical protein
VTFFPTAATGNQEQAIMTLNEALIHLDRVADYLNNLLDTRHPLSNEEIERVITDIDAVQEGLQQGLSQNVEG